MAASLAATPATADLGDIAVHGFIGQGYLNSSHNNYLMRSEEGSMQFNEFGLNFSTDLSDEMRFGLQLFSYDMGEVGNNEISIDWAYLDYALDERFGLRMGRIKQPNGLHNETVDVDAVRPYILLPSSVYDLTFRDVSVALNGVGAYGHFDLREAGGLSYQILYGSNNLSSDGGVTRVINDVGLFTLTSFDIAAVVTGSLAWSTPLNGLRFSATATQSDWEGAGPTTPALVGLGYPPTISMHCDDYMKWVGSAEYLRGPLSLTGEYSRLTGDIVMPEIDALEKFNAEGWYAQAAWRFTDWLEGSAYRSERYPDADDKSGKTFAVDHQAYLKAWVVSARFDVTPNLLVKVENHFVKGTDSLLKMDNLDGTTEDWSIFAIKSSLSF
jgi:hypothetical protein